MYSATSHKVEISKRKTEGVWFASVEMQIVLRQSANH